jgi:hypothetical protein
MFLVVANHSKEVTKACKNLTNRKQGCGYARSGKFEKFDYKFSEVLKFMQKLAIMKLFSKQNGVMRRCRRME